MASSANLTITPSLVVVLLNPHQTLDPPTHRCSAWIVFIAMLDGFLGVACHRLSGPGPHGWKWHGQSCNHLANVARFMMQLAPFFLYAGFYFLAVAAPVFSLDQISINSDGARMSQFCRADRALASRWNRRPGACSTTVARNSIQEQALQEVECSL